MNLCFIQVYKLRDWPSLLYGRINRNTFIGIFSPFSKSKIGLLWRSTKHRWFLPQTCQEEKKMYHYNRIAKILLSLYILWFIFTFKLNSNLYIFIGYQTSKLVITQTRSQWIHRVSSGASFKLSKKSSFEYPLVQFWKDE